MGFKVAEQGKRIALGKHSCSYLVRIVLPSHQRDFIESLVNILRYFVEYAPPQRRSTAMVHSAVDLCAGFFPGLSLWIHDFFTDGVSY